MVARTQDTKNSTNARCPAHNVLNKATWQFRIWSNKIPALELSIFSTCKVSFPRLMIGCVRPMSIKEHFEQLWKKRTVELVLGLLFFACDHCCNYFVYFKCTQGIFRRNTCRHISRYYVFIWKTDWFSVFNSSILELFSPFERRIFVHGDLLAGLRQLKSLISIQRQRAFTKTVTPLLGTLWRGWWTATNRSFVARSVWFSLPALCYLFSYFFCCCFLSFPKGTVSFIFWGYIVNYTLQYSDPLSSFSS